MKDSIPLHPKYGLNPSMEVCFYCQKETGSIVLLGNKYPDEAPRHITTSYEPCEKCKEAFSQGFLLLEAEDNAYNKPVPTGNYWVISMEAAERMFQDLSGYPEHKALITRRMAERLGLYQQAA